MNELTLSTALETALNRIEDMLSDDDGQAFKEARKFLPVGRAALATQPGAVGERMEAGLKVFARRFGHIYWGAGEKDCPDEIKAPNGELFKLRCKKCGEDNPKSKWCSVDAAAPTEAKPAPAPGYCKHCKQYTIEEPLPAQQDDVDADLVKFARRWEMLAYMHTRGVPFSVYDHYIGNPERLDYAATLHREYLAGELERAAIKGAQHE